MIFLWAAELNAIFKYLVLNHLRCVSKKKCTESVFAPDT